MTVRPLFAPPQAARSDLAARAEAAPTEAPATLSDAERQALAQQFPEAPALTLRLYGPTRTAAEPAPALGAHLDLLG